MEKSPSERKPNRAFRGRIIKAAIAEALDMIRKPTLPPAVEYSEIGIGATDLGQLRLVEPVEPDHWNNWNDAA